MLISKPHFIHIEYTLVSEEAKPDLSEHRQVLGHHKYSQKYYFSSTSREYSPMYDSWQNLLELTPIVIVSSKQHVKMEFLWLDNFQEKYKSVTVN